MNVVEQTPSLDLAEKAVEYEVSIIIVSFNTRDILRECLQSVIRETSSIPAEILVVDNASSDGSAAMVRTEFPSVKLYESPINLGFAEANNEAMRRATGRYFVLLNSDAFFKPGALATAIANMDANPRVGLGGCLLVGRDDTQQPSARTFHSVVNDLLVLTGLAYKYPRSRFFGRFDRTWADPTQAAPVDWVPGAFSIVRPSALQTTGLFDSSFFLYYEEVDLCRRMKDAGWTVWYWPDVQVIHIGGESSRQLTRLEFSTAAAQIVLWRMRSTLIYYRKHHGWHAWLIRRAEQLLYRLIVVRNSFSRDPHRRERAQTFGKQIEIMDRAWRDTDGGRVSPARPW